MHLIHLIQIAFALAVIGWSLRSLVRRVLPGLCDPVAAEHLSERRSTDTVEVNLGANAQLGQTWAVRIWLAAARGDSAEAEELAMDLRHLRLDTGRVAVTLGRLGSVLGLLAAMGFMLWAWAGPQGVEGLAAGRVERLAAGDALLSIGLGMGTGIYARAARRHLTGMLSKTETSCRRLLQSMNVFL